MRSRTLGKFFSSLSLSLHTHEMGKTIIAPISGLAGEVKDRLYVKLLHPAWHEASAFRCLHWLLDIYLMTKRTEEQVQEYCTNRTFDRMTSLFFDKNSLCICFCSWGQLLHLKKDTSLNLQGKRRCTLRNLKL